MRERLLAMLSGFFGALAVVLATVGLYGVIAYMVARRTNEIGIRMALGATPLSVQKLVLKEGLLLVGTGVVLGFGIALGVARLLSGMLFGVGAADPLSVGAAALALSVIALVACYLPARSATRLDPLLALHDA